MASKRSIRRNMVRNADPLDGKGCIKPAVEEAQLRMLRAPFGARFTHAMWVIAGGTKRKLICLRFLLVVGALLMAATFISIGVLAATR
jgi:hypothetical protein